MRFTTIGKALGCAVLLAFVQFSASAHTGLKESTPANGVTVTAAPSEIKLTFFGGVKLIKLELMGVGHEMPTSFEPNSEPQADFVFATPGMHPGAFTVNWAAIGADGHTLTDSFAFEVDPASSEESSAP